MNPLRMAARSALMMLLHGVASGIRNAAICAAEQLEWEVSRNDARRNGARHIEKQADERAHAAECKDCQRRSWN